MILNEETSIFSSAKKKNPRIASISTKITTANWSPDHTSRPPSSFEIEPQAPVHESLYALQVHKEKLLNFRKYFEGILKQLQNNSNVAIHKIEIKKNEILAKVELKFKACLSEIKSRENLKTYKILKGVREIAEKLKKNDEIIERISRSLRVDDEEINEVLMGRMELKRFNENWLEIPICDLDLMEVEKKAKEFKAEKKDHWSKNSCNKKRREMCQKRTQSFYVDVEEFTQSQDGPGQIISKLFTEKSQTFQPKANNKIQLFVPYGFPSYSCFYLLTVPQNFTIKKLCSHIKKELHEQNEFSILIKTSPTSLSKELTMHDEIPEFSNNGWPKLYLKLSN